MKAVQVLFEINDDMTLKSCDIEYNDTGRPSDMKLIEGIAEAIITNKELTAKFNEAKELFNPDQKKKK